MARIILLNEEPNCDACLATIRIIEKIDFNNSILETHYLPLIGKKAVFQIENEDGSLQNFIDKRICL